MCAAKTVAKKKFGYQRSFALTGPGLRLHFWKAVLSAKARNRELTKRTVSQAKKCEIDLTVVETLTKQEVRKRIRATISDLWQAQKNVTHSRVYWLKNNAQDVARGKWELG